VLVVVEDRNVQLLAEAFFELEAPGRTDVLEIDPAEARGQELDGLDDLVDVLRGKADRERVALPSITGSAASGPMSPRPSTAVPSVTTATLFCFMVREKARWRSSLMARHTRATPGVQTMERSSRVRIGTLLWISIFPPRCMRKVRSDTLTTRTPFRRFSRATICWPCSLSRALIVMSRMIRWPLDSTRSTAPMSPPASPMASATRPSMPGRFRIPRRTVRL
jgi:hypothetical protein